MLLQVSQQLIVTILLFCSSQLSAYTISQRNLWRKFKQIDDEVRVTEDNCQVPLGVANRGIVPRYGLRASDGAAYRGRLHQPTAWTSRKPLYFPGQGTRLITTKSAWIQVDLIRLNLITGIQTQGDRRTQTHVTWYYVYTSVDCSQFRPLFDNDGLIARYHGNYDGDTVVTNYFHELREARCVRIVPLQIVGQRVALRFEVLGCDARTCSEAILKHLSEDAVGTYQFPPVQGTASLQNNPQAGADLQHIGVPQESPFSREDVDSLTKPTEVMTDAAEFRFGGEKLVVGLVLYTPIGYRDVTQYYTVNASRNCRDWEAMRSDYMAGQVTIFTKPATPYSSVWFSFSSYIRAHCIRIIPTSQYHNMSAIQAHFIGCGTGDEQPGCGRLSKAPTRTDTNRRQKRVIGGVPGHVQFMWPWLVSLKLLEGRDTLHHACGGSIIHPRWILTAAHCIAVIHSRAFEVDPVRNFTAWNQPSLLRRVKVTVAEHSLLVSDGPQHQADVDAIIVLPTYNMSSFGGDVALLRLTSDLRFTDQISPVCVPAVNHRQPVFDSSSHCEVIGWGRTGANSFPTRPHHVRIPLVDFETCQSNYSHINLTAGMMCAGKPDGSVDACLGDSGGPLVCQTAFGQWMQVGIASWNIGCGYAGYPGVYAKVATFMGWIHRTIVNNTPV